ncbi:hypothetical protein ACOME3_007416 [Neoechinorhynchus agilis]
MGLELNQSMRPFLNAFQLLSDQHCSFKPSDFVSKDEDAIELSAISLPRMFHPTGRYFQSAKRAASSQYGTKKRYFTSVSDSNKPDTQMERYEFIMKEESPCKRVPSRRLDPLPEYIPLPRSPIQQHYEYRRATACHGGGRGRRGGDPRRSQRRVEELNDGRQHVIRRFRPPASRSEDPNPEKVLVDLSPVSDPNETQEREALIERVLVTRTDYELFDAAINIITGDMESGSNMKRNFSEILNNNERPMHASTSGISSFHKQSPMDTKGAVKEGQKNILDQYDDNNEILF